MDDDFKLELLKLNGIANKNVVAVLKEFPTEKTLLDVVQAEGTLPFSKKVNHSLITYALSRIEAKEIAATESDLVKTEDELSQEKDEETESTTEETVADFPDPNIERSETPDVIEQDEVPEEKKEEKKSAIDRNPMMILNMAGYNLRFQKGTEVYILYHRGSIPVKAIPRWVMQHPEYKNLRRDKLIMFKPLKTK